MKLHNIHAGRFNHITPANMNICSSNFQWLKRNYLNFVSTSNNVWNVGDASLTSQLWDVY
jgi:hypothetical protein